MKGAAFTLVVFYVCLLSQSQASTSTNTFRKRKARFVQTFTCPEPGKRALSLPSGKKVKIRIAKKGILCTLTTTRNNGEDDIPVSRSYDENNWERVAGPYASASFLQIDCDDNTSICEMNIPEKEVNDQTFSLQSFSSSVSQKDEIARFLEQTTFGATQKDLNDLMDQASKDDKSLWSVFKRWTMDQINNVPLSSHRGFFRTHLASPVYTPQKHGLQRRPCQVGSRWRWYAFSRSDLGKYLSVTKINNRFALSINGEIRTMVDSVEFKSGNTFQYDKRPSYKITWLSEEVSGGFMIVYEGRPEVFRGGNPRVDFRGMNPSPRHIIDISVANKRDFEAGVHSGENKYNTVIMKREIQSNACSSIPYPLSNTKPVYGRLSNGQHMIFEPTIVLQTNTNINPSKDGGGKFVLQSNGVSMCANVERSFLNEENCVLSTDTSACAAYGKVEGTITLNANTLRQFYQKTGRPVYAVTNLRFEDEASVLSPCNPGERSRWIVVDGPCVENVKIQTSELFSNILRRAPLSNKIVKDIYLGDSGSCHWKDATKTELFVNVDGVCHKSVHPDTYNIYDFTSWQRDHPGGQNAIISPAKKGFHKLQFPANHPMSRWSTRKQELEFVGTLGDNIEFVDIPVRQLQSRQVAESFGLYTAKPEGKNILICGSPYEYGNWMKKVPRFHLSQVVDSGMNDLEFGQQRRTVWIEIALNAEDQLRQRVAWGLSQLLVISPSSVVPHNTETFVNFYDIFVRNAFGNYKDILREVSYSPLMADMLTYYESKSTEYVYQKYGRVQFADENFAREIMQLFSIGLVELNSDGTMKLDENDVPIQTYSNDDITEYARVWTGFTRQGVRGNVDEREFTNSIDPMKVRIEWRDQFPKMGLKGEYLGDRYPLCKDLPPDSFLRKGAKWKLLGKTKISNDQDLKLERKYSADSPNSDVKVTVLDQSSNLRRKLCDPIDGKCTFPSVVELPWNVPCVGVECSQRSIRIVKVGEVYYEFIRPSCVHLHFFGTGKVISTSKSTWWKGETKCVSKDNAVASAACCDASSVAFSNKCTYTGERVSYTEARSICLSSDQQICRYQSISANCGTCCNYAGHYWTNSECSPSVIVDSDGRVAMNTRDGDSEHEYDTLTFFRVQWDGNYPSAQTNSCGLETCRTVGQFCECTVDVEARRVFSNVPTREQLLTNLHIGGLDPWMGTYVETLKEDSFSIHVADSAFPLGMNTVFEVIDDFGRTRYLKNMESIVKVSEQFTFRNPPSFYDEVPDVRDAYYETEAALDQYIYHENTAPFLSLRLMQRFGISNPSPKFVFRVGKAFKEGRVEGIPDIGSGKYGCMASMIATIVMDKESRNVLLDLDKSYGSLKEPLIRVANLMRGLDYRQTNGEFTSLHDMQGKIGMAPHDMPSVFSFFLPEYSPPALSSSSLVSPEALLLPFSVGLMNGLISLIKFGLSPCYEGFSDRWCDKDFLKKIGGDFSQSVGRLKFSSTNKNESVIDDMATILTGGRLGSANRQLIKHIYSTIDEEKLALVTAQQLIVASPEFHTFASKTDNIGREKESAPKRSKSCTRHKNVIHLVLKGGWDSFNVLVPHSQCDGNDLYNQYKNARGPLAIDRRNLLQINAAGQPCKKFGLHPKLKFLQKLFNDEHALFVAGVGVLTEPVTKSDYMRKTKTQLFAHNTMQKEIGALGGIGTGTMGRLSDKLRKEQYQVDAFAVDAPLLALEGKEMNGDKASVNSQKGFQVLDPSTPYSQPVSAMLPKLNGESKKTTGIISKMWSDSLNGSIRRNNELFWAQKKLRDLSQVFPVSQPGTQLRQVARLAPSYECRGSSRDLYYIEDGGWDHHQDLEFYLNQKLEMLDDAIKAFTQEMKAIGQWKDTVMVITSDFGRTLSPNSSKGTDHGWSGTSVVLGGEVKGGRIIGDFPNDLSNSSPLNVGRGRLIPTTSFDAIFNGVSMWAGVTDSTQLDEILPNRKAFGSKIFSKSDLFIDRNVDVSNCEGEGKSVSCIPSDFEASNDDDAINFEWDSDDSYDRVDRVNNSGKIAGAVVGVLSVVIISLIAYMYNRETGYFANLMKRGDAVISDKKDGECSGHETASVDKSFETSFDIDTVHLLHLKESKGVELIGNNSEEARAGDECEVQLLTKMKNIFRSFLK